MIDVDGTIPKTMGVAARVFADTVELLPIFARMEFGQFIAETEQESACAWCGKPLTNRSQRAIWCKSNCQQRGWYHRNRDKANARKRESRRLAKTT